MSLAKYSVLAVFSGDGRISEVSANQEILDDLLSRNNVRVLGYSEHLFYEFLERKLYRVVR